MRVARPPSLVLVCVSLPFPIDSQQASTTPPTPPQRDSQAVALLQQSVAAFGTVQPTDSTATGNVTITEGSLTMQGKRTCTWSATLDTYLPVQ